MAAIIVIIISVLTSYSFRFKCCLFFIQYGSFLLPVAVLSASPMANARSCT